MSTTKTTHIERTAREPRDTSLHTVNLRQITQINPQIRLLRLSPPPGNSPIKFLPGQWLDVHIPQLSKPGGFTITSTPSTARPSSSKSPDPNTTITTPHSNTGYVELAIQNQPLNPAAAWLWRPIPEILHQTLQVRVGGSFVWPPPSDVIAIDDMKRVVLIAGGVGINPLMSIVSHLAEEGVGQGEGKGQGDFEVTFLYSLKDPGEGEGERDIEKILFLERLRGIFHVQRKVKGRLELYLTPTKGAVRDEGVRAEKIDWVVPFWKRRVTKEDVVRALGPVEERKGTVCYICGVPTMTDEFVNLAQNAEGMDPKTVLFERWW